MERPGNLAAITTSAILGLDTQGRSNLSGSMRKGSRTDR